MKRHLIALAALATACSSAIAQTPLHPGVSSLLFWKGDQQAVGFRTIETIYKTHTIHRGPHVYPLPMARSQIQPTLQLNGKTLTVDAYMKAYRVSGLLVLKDGKIILERYGLNRGPDDRWTSFSVAKSLTSTLVGAAILDGKIKSLDSKVVDYVPELKGGAYDVVTLRQLLTMSSGVRWNEDYADPKSDVAQAGTGVLEPGVDPMVSYLRKLPRATPPGSRFNYNTAETDLAGIVVSNAVGMPLADYASRKIWKPFGMEKDAVWMTDLADRERGGCCISMTLRDYARFGQFILDGGKAAGAQVVAADWVSNATRVQIDNGSPPPAGYGYFWWISSPDLFHAEGIFGQAISVFRKERLIIVQNSAWPTAVGPDLEAAQKAFVSSVKKAAD